MKAEQLKGGGGQEEYCSGGVGGGGFKHLEQGPVYLGHIHLSVSENIHVLTPMHAPIVRL